MNFTKSLHCTLAAVGIAGIASAQIVPTVVVNSDIATSTVWGPPNIYELDGEIHVLDGATLTILPGTVIASDTVVAFPGTSGPASLSVDRGAMIIANGTRTQPIVFTSKSDGTTPAGGLASNMNGTHRQAATAEWGGVTVHGEGYVSYCVSGTTNTAAPASTNEAPMEGILRAGIRNYGGGKVASTMPSGYVSDGDGDNDDSGSLSYVSIRYNGFIAGSTVELNGLGLGGVGRNTDVHHIESLNSLDDGVEIWGGTVNCKYVVVWNCGDDSFDVDQGWRGKAQHGLIVQGYTFGSAQGSGISDNVFEMDGAEQCHWQPVTSSIIANFTVVGGYDWNGTGNPTTGNNGADHATEWRDNARVQFHRNLWIDIGDQLIFRSTSGGQQGSDNERCHQAVAGAGYGCNGTLTWANTWTTSSATTSGVNPFPGGAEASAAEAYTAQAAGNLIEWRDNLVVNQNAAVAFLTEANNRGVFAPFAGNNANNVLTTSNPIAITRQAGATIGGIDMALVTFLDPRPTTVDAQLSTEWAPITDGFLDGSRYRGGFGEGNLWTTGWTAVDAYNLIAADNANVDMGFCYAGVAGCPQQVTSGTWAANTNVTITVKNLDPLFSQGFLIAGFIDVSFLNFTDLGGVLVPSPDILLPLTGAPGSGQAVASFINPPGGSGVTIYTQFLGVDAVLFGSGKFSFSNAQAHLQP